MITAKRANEMTERATEKEIATRRTRAEEFCNALDEQITEACESRMNCLTIKEIPSEIRNYIIKILQDNSYRLTELNSSTIQICW